MICEGEARAEEGLRSLPPPSFPSSHLTDALIVSYYSHCTHPGSENCFPGQRCILWTDTHRRQGRLRAHATCIIPRQQPQQHCEGRAMGGDTAAGVTADCWILPRAGGVSALPTAGDSVLLAAMGVTVAALVRLARNRVVCM
jgi:hypothetical protein